MELTLKIWCVATDQCYARDIASRISKGFGAVIFACDIVFSLAFESF
jgi:hypothetical protein